MTRNLGLAGAADLFGTQLGNDELAILELDLYAELASVRPYDDALRALESLKRAGLKVALCSNLATPMPYLPSCYYLSLTPMPGASRWARSNRSQRSTNIC